MNTPIDISGDVYGLLTAVKRVESESRGALWECNCDCGNVSVVLLDSLRSGRTKSCGCLRKKCTSNLMTIHGMTDSPEYETWKGMKKRCYNDNSEYYHRYGGRGISVCDEWINDFEVFFSDMGERPDNSYSIDRIDNDGNYTPENCRWASRQQQARNKSESDLTLYNGESKTLIEWCEDLNLNYRTVKSRLKTGWSVHDALNKPTGSRGGKGMNTEMYLKGMRDCKEGKPHTSQCFKYDAGYSDEFAKQECLSQGEFN